MSLTPGIPAPPLPDVVLLANASGTPTSAVYYWTGGQGELRASGTTTGTVALQQQAPDGSWQAVSAGTTLAAAGNTTFTVGPCQLRVVVTGGPAVALYVALTRIQSRTRR